MKILVDADACGVKGKIEKLARRFGINVIMICDTNHLVESDYAEVRYVDPGKDSADFAILNKCQSGDIVVTNDGGLAAMVTAKKATAINSFGRIYSTKEIESALWSRYLMNMELKKRNGRHKIKGTHFDPHARTNFTESLLSLLNNPNAAMAG